MFSRVPFVIGGLCSVGRSCLNVGRAFSLIVMFFPSPLMFACSPGLVTRFGRFVQEPSGGRARGAAGAPGRGVGA